MQGEEEGEAAKVHVALGVELAGLDLHAVGTEVGSTIRAIYVSCGHSGRRTFKVTYLTAEPSLEKADSSCCTRYTRLTLSMNRIRMKMNVI